MDQSAPGGELRLLTLPEAAQADDSVRVFLTTVQAPHIGCDDHLAKTPNLDNELEDPCDGLGSVGADLEVHDKADSFGNASEELPNSHDLKGSESRW